MKHFDYLYFNIYHHFYRISQERPSFDPRLQTMYLFSIGAGGWLLLLETLYLQVIRHSRFSSQAESTIFAASIYMLTAVLFNYVFIGKDRDLKIFGKYERLANKNPKRKWPLIISAGILLLPYLILISRAVFSTRHGQ